MEQELPFDQTTDEGRKDFKIPCERNLLKKKNRLFFSVQTLTLAV